MAHPYKLLPIVAIGLLLSRLAVSCGSEGTKEDPVPVLSVKSETVTGEAGSQFASVTATGSWSITVSASWLTVSPSSGSGSTSSVIVEYSENTGESREATITLTGSSGYANVKITQSKKTDSGGSAEATDWKDSYAKVKWLELPATDSQDGYDFLTHGMTIDSKPVRNYSLYWDYGNLVAKWVAYPLCTGNIGNAVSRTDTWGLDPLLASDKQPVLFSAYADGNSGWRARGHQIPSADRLTSYSANSKTFYFTNMTPQINDNFNSSIWANLEGKVRNWAKSSDTLYVVTGCVTDGSTGYCLDNYGKKVTIPVGYFKAVLRYKKSSTIGYNDFMGCAVYLEHKEYSSSAVSSSYSMSISDLEKKLGYKLFVNLPDKVGNDVAEKIKDQNPATISWWW